MKLNKLQPPWDEVENWIDAEKLREQAGPLVRGFVGRARVWLDALDVAFLSPDERRRRETLASVVERTRSLAALAHAARMNTLDAINLHHNRVADSAGVKTVLATTSEVEARAEEIAHYRQAAITSMWVNRKMRRQFESDYDMEQLESRFGEKRRIQHHSGYYVRYAEKFSEWATKKLVATNAVRVDADGRMEKVA